MKKIYEKPSLVVESFVTESVMDQENLLSETVTKLGYEEATSNFITFGDTDATVLTGIDYTQFIN